MVYEIRAFWEDAAVDHGTTSEGSLRYRATRALETWAIKRVATCSRSARAAPDILARGVPESRVTVIPTPSMSDGFQLSGAPDDALKARLASPASTVVGFVGSFYAYEGPGPAARRVSRAARRQPDLRLLLVGGGPRTPTSRPRPSGWASPTR